MENMGVTKERESLGVSVLGLNGAVCFGAVSLTDRFVCRELEPDFTKNIYKQIIGRSCSARCNSPTDRRSPCVPEIHAPPARCPGSGCMGSDWERASCWAD